MTACAHCRSGSPCERHFQQQVIELAHLCGWRVAHFRPARTEKGWRTPVAADGAGFPDLVMLRGEELLVLELKSDKGKATDEQQEWLAAFGQVSEAAALCLRPVQWPLIEAALK